MLKLPEANSTRMIIDSVFFSGCLLWNRLSQFIENCGIDELIMMLKIKPKELEEN